LTFSLTNPSNITISVGDINFDVVMNEFNTVIGRVYITNTVIPPGAKTYSAVLHLGEGATNSKAISQTLGDYLTSASVPLTIQGSSQSTTILPLNPALAAVKLSSSMTGIAGNLIDSIAVSGSIIGLIIENKATTSITLRNPLDTPYAIKSIQAAVTFKPTSGAAPFQVGTIDYTLPSPVSVPAKGSTKTDPWPVSISGSGLNHYIQLLGLLTDPNKYFDVQQNVTVIVGDGYNTQMYYYQDHVPFSITIDGLITFGNIQSQSIPANLSSITDQSQLQQAIIDLLSGKTPATSSILPSANVTASSIAPSLPISIPNILSTPTATTTAKDTSTETTTINVPTEKATTTAETAKVTATAAAITTTAGGLHNILPF
jgi:LEA14-like dessication related protein